MKLNFNIWDTFCWVKNFDLARIYAKGSSGILLLFSLYKHQSFENLDKCIEVMDKASISSSNILVLLVGTATDKKKRIKSKDSINHAI